MSVTRVQNERGTGQGLDTRRKGLPRRAMTIIVNDCCGNICKDESRLSVIVLPKLFAGVNSHRDSHGRQYIQGTGPSSDVLEHQLHSDFVSLQGDPWLAQAVQL